jgi:hypothetical protein
MLEELGSKKHIILGDYRVVRDLCSCKKNRR